jgi:hypothetical protein
MKALAQILFVCGVLSLAAVGTAEESDSQARATEAPTVLPKVTVHKNASCGCCGSWIEHLRHHGFEVVARNVDNLAPIKQRVGVPYGKGSCHTAEVAGYFIEGHVPAAEIERLLREKPRAKGLTVPGMPIGSPGMESGDRIDPYEVLLVHDDGTTSVYAKYPK